MLSKSIVAVAAVAAHCCARAQSSPITLEQASTAALSHRPSISAAMERVRAARDRERELGVAPPLRLEFGYGTRPELGIGNDLFLAAPIDVFGKAHAQRAVARAQRLSAEAALNQVALDLQTEVFTDYGAMLSAQMMLENGKQMLDLTQIVYTATQQRIAAGDLPPNQLLRADLELQRAKQTLAIREHAYDSARRILAAAIGEPERTIEAVDGKLPPPPPSRPLEQRPDVLAAQATVAAARADRGVARSSTSPDLELQVARDYWDASGRYVARIQFVWNFFDYGASRSRRSGATHTAQSAAFSLEDLNVQAREQVQTTRTDYLSAVQEMTGYDVLIENARTLLDKERQAFQEGANTLIDVTDATRSLRDIEQQAADARTRALLAQSRYLAATGTLIGNLPPRSNR